MHFCGHRRGTSVWNGKEAERRKPAFFVDGFLARIRIFDWGSREAKAYAELRAKQGASGKTLGNLDLLIAAHAISAGAVLVTNDRAFAQVKGLRGTANWAADLQ